MGFGLHQLITPPPPLTSKIANEMKFVATELRSDGKKYGVDFEAANWGEAEKVCEENGWTLDGELHFTIPASEAFGHKEADEMIAALDEREEATKQ